MQLSRREFTFALGTSISALALCPKLRASPHRRADFFEWKQLREGVHAGFGQGGNVGVIQTESGAVLIDAKNAPFARTLRREAGALGKEVVLLINTHHHADHTGGNYGFSSGDGPVRIIMHPKAKPRVTAQVERYASQIRNAPGQLGNLSEDVPEAAREEILAAAKRADELGGSDFAPEITLPEAMFRGMDLPLGGIEFTLTHVGSGHTDNDVFVFIKDHNVLHTGDLLFHGRHPFMDTSAKANSEGWIRSCHAMLEACDDETVVIPGHGEITDAEGIRKQVAYFEGVRDAAKKALASGESREDFVQRDLEVFEGYGGAQIKQRTLGTIYDEMTDG